MYQWEHLPGSKKTSSDPPSKSHLKTVFRPEGGLPNWRESKFPETSRTLIPFHSLPENVCWIPLLMTTVDGHPWTYWDPHPRKTSKRGVYGRTEWDQVRDLTELRLSICSPTLSDSTTGLNLKIRGLHFERTDMSTSKVIRRVDEVKVPVVLVVVSVMSNLMRPPTNPRRGVVVDRSRL